MCAAVAVADDHGVDPGVVGVSSKFLPVPLRSFCIGIGFSWDTGRAVLKSEPSRRVDSGPQPYG